MLSCKKTELLSVPLKNHKEHFQSFWCQLTWEVIEGMPKYLVRINLGKKVTDYVNTKFKFCAFLGHFRTTLLYHIVLTMENSSENIQRTRFCCQLIHCVRQRNVH